ncbi:MAG TPA: hypothetical protein ENJ95_04050 [Bacteroidetes bacterium]|nr:hypothetical protein [Bacteroidota bacterium]
MYFTKKHLFLIIALFSLHTAFGQQKTTALKLSGNFFRGGAANIPSFRFGIEQGPFSGLAPAIILTNEDKFNYHEIELSRVSFRSGENTFGKTEQRIFEARYEFGKSFWITGEKMKYRLGGSLGLYYGSSDFTPSTTSRFPVEESNFGVSLSFTPHLDIEITERLYVDINPSLLLLDYGIVNSQAHNPLLPERWQAQQFFELDAGGFLFRLGVAYKM